jgi:hypothetical protein
MTQYIGQITIILEAGTSERACETLRCFATQLDDTHPEIIFADHNGDIEDCGEVERECGETSSAQCSWGHWRNAPHCSPITTNTRAKKGQPTGTQLPPSPGQTRRGCDRNRAHPTSASSDYWRHWNPLPIKRTRTARWNAGAGISSPPLKPPAPSSPGPGRHRGNHDRRVRRETQPSPSWNPPIKRRFRFTDPVKRRNMLRINDR